MKRGILFLLLLIDSGWAVAQFRARETAIDDKAYTEGLTAFKQGRYDDALARFGALAKDYSNQERSVYSHYLYASAANRLDKTKEGIQMLQQLLSRFPNWSHKDEAYYLGAELNFKLKNYYKGLDYLNRITTSALQTDVEGLKQYYFADVREVAALKAMHKQYPGDRIVAGALVNAIRSAPHNKSDAELATHLIYRFELSEQAKKAVTAEAKTDKSGGKIKAEDRLKQKKVFDVSVLLPFRIDEFVSNQRSRSNQFVFDYYQGLVLAQAQLKREKIDVRLSSYDIGTSEIALKNLGHDPEFLRSDLLIGPLYQNTSEVAASFSNEREVVVVNPLSTDSKLLSNKYPNYYLAHPSLEEQIRQVVKVAESIDRKLVAAIYYGETSKDSTMAALYENAVRSKNGVIAAKIKIGYREAEMVEKVQKYTAEPTHLVLFSTDSRTGPALLNVLRDPGDTVPLISTSVSFDLSGTKFGAYTRSIYLLDTDFVDEDKQEIKKFQKDYYDLTNTLPSVYSYQAYDHLLFFGRMLAKYRHKINDGISTRTYAGAPENFLLAGFDFRGSRENTVFCIRKYEHGRWRTIDF